ncbi:MAG: hypothetical protein NVS3B29_00720 [Candidatus Saccharimonadales bacterium]
MAEARGNKPSGKIPVPDNSSRELLAQAKARVLFGWLTPQEAVPMLLSGADDDPMKAEARHAEMVAEVSKREKYTSAPTLVKEAGRWDLKALAGRPDIVAAFQGSSWRLAAIDLSKVLAFQKTVRLPGLDERITEAAKSPQALRELCLPSEHPETPITWAPDTDGKGYTLSSFNPNFRVFEVIPGTATVPTAPGQPQVNRNAIFVTYGAPPSYLQVAVYKDRYFLRDGYHRAVALMRAGITEVPCVLITAGSLKQVFTAAGNFVTEDVMMGDKPPFIRDFVNDKVSAEGDLIEFRRIIRIRGDEFIVPS